uniref:Protein kinase domain-containing protein n=1 Tax=Ascaris lumbricoides TaxID=6252 RepID=A0A0M3I8L9_ASCLU
LFSGAPTAVERTTRTARSVSPITGKEAPQQPRKQEPIGDTARARTPQRDLWTAKDKSPATGKEASARAGEASSYGTERETSTRTARLDGLLTWHKPALCSGHFCITKTRATKTSHFLIRVPILCTASTDAKTKVVLHSINTSPSVGKNLVIEKKMAPEVTASNTVYQEPINWNHMEETNSCARRSEKSHLDSSSAVSARSCMSELITAQSGTPSEGTILAAVAASFIKEKPFTSAPPKHPHTRERRWILRQRRRHAYYLPYDAKVANGAIPDPELFANIMRCAPYPEPSMAQSEGYFPSRTRSTGVTKSGTYVKPSSDFFISGANPQRVQRLPPSNDLPSLNKQVDWRTFNFADAASFACNRPSPAAANVSAAKFRKTTSTDLQKNNSFMQQASSGASTCATEKPSFTAYLKGKPLSSAAHTINGSLPWQMYGVGNLNMQQPCPAWITKSDVSSFFTTAYSQAVDRNKRLQSHSHKRTASSFTRRGKRESRARYSSQPQTSTFASKTVDGSIQKHSTLPLSPHIRGAQSSTGGSALKKLIPLTPDPCKKLRISQDLARRSDTAEKSSSLSKTTFASVSRRKQARTAHSSSTAVHLRQKRDLHDHAESEAKEQRLPTIHSSQRSAGQYQKSLHASRHGSDGAKYRNKSRKIKKNVDSDTVGLQPSSRIVARTPLPKTNGALTAERSLKFNDKKKLSSSPFSNSQQSFHTTGNFRNETSLKHRKNNPSDVLPEAASKKQLSLQTEVMDSCFKGKTSAGSTKNVSLSSRNMNGDSDASRGIAQASKTIAVNRSKTTNELTAEIASNNEEELISGTDSSEFIKSSWLPFLMRAALVYASFTLFTSKYIKGECECATLWAFLLNE